jgi:hypothetical protein
MKKILFIFGLLAITFGLSQVVFAEKENNTSEKDRAMGRNSITSTTPTTTPGYPAVCLQNAIGVREDGIMGAYNTRATAINAAMQTRKTALVTAWGIADVKERNKVRKAAWDTYNKARKTARTTYNATNKNVWKTFHAAAKACGVKSTGVEPESMDQALSD